MALTANAYYNALPQDNEAERERWRKDPNVRQLALDILAAWGEIRRHAEHELGDCPIVLGEVQDEFNFTKREIETGYVQRGVLRQ